MKKLSFLAMLLGLAPGLLRAQSECAPMPLYSPCDVVFELNDAEAGEHPAPHESVTLRAELRSPRVRTFLITAFWDGGRRMVLRMTPTEAGAWDYRVTSNIARFQGMTGKFTATPSDSLGFVRAASVHHFQYTEAMKPHFWMGDTCLPLATLDATAVDRLVAARSAQKFNHVRFYLTGGGAQDDSAFRGQWPEASHFRKADERIRALNAKNIVADVVVAPDLAAFQKRFPTWQDRERFLRYAVSRFGPLNITWQLTDNWEDEPFSRPLLKEMGVFVKGADSYQQLRSTGARFTSAPLAEDGWMTYVTYQSADDQLGAIEHQLYALPFVNQGFGFEDGAGLRRTPQHVDAAGLRQRAWNARMNGQYVTYGNTATGAALGAPFDAAQLDSPGARHMTALYDFFATTRFWDLEPYFDVEGGRGLALESALEEVVEYVVYAENAGKVAVDVEKRGWDVAWFDPVTGELQRQKKDFKGERFEADTPTRDHDWALHLFREGKMESMARSYKFESRRIELQIVEQTPGKVPFEVLEPSKDPLGVGKSYAFDTKLLKETKASRAMVYLWTGEIVAAGQGYRVFGTGPRGTFRMPADLSRQYPAFLNLRVYGLNGVGKVYAVDKTFRVTQ